MLKLISGILTIGLLATGCSSSTGPELSAAAAPEQQKMATPTSEPGSRPVAGTRAPTHSSTRAHWIGSGRTSRRGTGTNCGGTCLPRVHAAGWHHAAAGVDILNRVGRQRSGRHRSCDACATAVTVDGQEVLPAGTEVAGHVTEAERAGRVKGRARLAFRFTSLRHDDERMSLRTEPIVQEAEATKGEDATKIGIGAGAGAVIGAVVGGKSGAAKGAVIGGAAGTGVVVATRGKEVRLEPGTDIPVRLAAPLSIRVPVR